MMTPDPLPDHLAADPADPSAPTNERIRYLERWIRDCQSYNRNVSACYEAALADADDQRELVRQKNIEIRRLNART